MNEEIEKYFKELIEKYGDDNIRITTSDFDGEQLKQIPKVLNSLYELVSKARLPFGEVFTIESALKHSKESPFEPEWFAFGHDYYFSFWLCKYEPDDKGLSFTSWDHECSEIGKAVFGDIVSFLKDAEKEEEERKRCFEEDEEDE
jgi:hypothetical protein